MSTHLRRYLRKWLEHMAARRKGDVFAEEVTLSELDVTWMRLSPAECRYVDSVVPRILGQSPEAGR